MFIIDFKDKDFIILIEEYLERDEFMIIVNFFKRIFIQYVNGDWTIPFKRIDEILMWFDKYKYVYKLSDAAKIKLQEFKKSFRQETTFNRTLQLDESILNKDIKLYVFQKAGINWALKRDRFYIADDKGLGKTPQSAVIMGTLLNLKLVDFIIIIVRNGRILSWKYEILDFLNIIKEDDIACIFNEDKVKCLEFLQSKKILICANHIFPHIIASYRKDYSKIKRKLSKIHWNKPYVDLKKELNKNKLCLLCDEAHELNNSDAVRTKAIHSVKQYFDYIGLLSATPAIEHFEDWYPNMYLLDPSIIPMSEKAFTIDIAMKDEIGDEHSIYTINKYDPKKLDYWRKRFSINAIKRLKKDLPEVKTKINITPIYFELTKLQKELYQKVVIYELYRISEEYDKISLKLIIEKFPYLVQIIDNPLLLKGKIDNVEINKLLDKWTIDQDTRIEYLDEYIHDVVEKGKEKVAIFDNHPLTLDLLYHRYKKHNPLIVHGGTKDTEETKFEKEKLFNDKNSGHEIIFMNPTVTPGWNLHKSCRRELFYTIPNYALAMDQTLSRTDRITSVMDSEVELFLIAKSLDIIRYKRIFKRIEFNKEVLNQAISEEKLKDLVNGII